MEYEQSIKQSIKLAKMRPKKDCDFCNNERQVPVFGSEELLPCPVCLE